MMKTIRYGLLLILLLGLGACQVTPDNPTPPATSAMPPVGDEPITLTILYTNDEHGWMEGETVGAGAAEMMGLWTANEGYDPDGNYLVLSGGDMWTGAAISTWFDGESMVEVMNGMGYEAAAVGNHEFDFGLDTLLIRAEQMDFPLLSANIRDKETGETPTEWGLRPFTILDINGLRVGLVGLTSTSTPHTTNPTNVADFDFWDYEDALRDVVPQVQAEGADLIIVLAHACENDLLWMANKVADLGIAMIGGGHCNELFADEVNDILLLETNSYLRSYGRVTFQIDPVSKTIVDTDYALVSNEGGQADVAITRLIQSWRERTDAELNQTIGYTATGIDRYSPMMGNLITHAWLDQYPTAVVAITNRGGIRASLPEGDITLGDVVNIMPFDNVLVDLELTGDALLNVLVVATGDGAAIGGVRQAGVRWIVEETGEAIDPEASYSLLVNDFMYAGGDTYGLLSELDPQGYNTEIDWRQLVLDWIEAQETSTQRPLEIVIP